MSVPCEEIERVDPAGAQPGRWHRDDGGAMPLLQLLMILIVVGFVLWLVNNFIPMAGSIKTILNAVVVIVVVIWLLQAFGVMSSLTNIRIGR
jgi:hypothetical protein